ncbi:nose resistant to fluoxetine protein 6-like [Centruroides sculpturatus]|uniref:nose resistant to fluoxetine protein 6-like n=1 Tax=Centruroides sculpturatus TaxID=218467 RepID=UPI000C6EB04B|nr:nose resistant to fluoxetine protein 6-like [Centruroides sculpturatus]
MNAFITDPSPNNNIILLFTIFSPYAWIIGQTWMCIDFTKGNGGKIRKFLSMDFFVILDRLNVAIYILHPLTLIYVIACTTKPFDLSMLTLCMLHVFVMFLSIIFSFLFYLFLETPFKSIVNNLFFKFDSNKTKSMKNQYQLLNNKKFKNL